jgi:glycosyltransferase involved in cell wall biosynthesis
MKLIIQIPCYNEAQTLPDTLKSLPETIEGIQQIEVLVVDDGSTDDTFSVAKELNVDHILRIPNHIGLAGAFKVGIENALRHGADIIVNTDGDNQYYGEDIPKLIEPIFAKRADIVIGDRGVATNPSFSILKRLFQRIGSQAVQVASGMKTPDATSGFRALTREAALRTIVLSEFTYTLETLIQAGSEQLNVEYIPIRTNPQTRPSRLMRNISHYLIYSTSTFVRAYTMYRPLRVFTILGSIILLGGLAIGIRFLIFFFTAQGQGHVQSLILAAILLIVGFQVLLIGLLADLINSNRKILEEVLYPLRRIELNQEEEAEDSADDL